MKLVARLRSPHLRARTMRRSLAVVRHASLWLLVVALAVVAAVFWVDSDRAVAQTSWALAVTPALIFTVWASLHTRTESRLLRLLGSLLSPALFSAILLRLVAIQGTYEYALSGRSGEAYRWVGRLASRIGLRPAIDDLFAPRLPRLQHWIWEYEWVVLVGVVIGSVVLWLYTLTLDHLALFRLGSVHARDRRRYFRCLVWTSLVEHPAAATLVAGTVLGIIALYVRSAGSSVATPVAPGLDVTSPLGAIVALVFIAAYFGPLFTTKLESTARATYERKIRDIFLRSVPEVVVLGYGSLGRRTTASQVQREWYGARHRFVRVTLPGLSELLAEEIHARRTSVPRRSTHPPARWRPLRPLRLQMRVAWWLVVADRDSSRFRGVIQLDEGLRLGFAVVDIPRDDGRGDHVFLVPTVIGDFNNRSVVDRCGLTTARVVISTVPTSDLPHRILHDSALA
ncbi:MAG: hypothetical protein IT460_09875 [Planctomycetes bacterium]|nr:hypothetical protein [Planctomycetota bacterium]